MQRISLVLFVALAACGGGGGGGGGGGDDDVTPDAGDGGGDNTVVEVACPATPDADVESTGGFRFSPNAVTIPVNGVVRFTNPAAHNIVPTPPNTDDGLRVDFNATTCLQFTAPGAFDYHCVPHPNMTGTITVQ